MKKRHLLLGCALALSSLFGGYWLGRSAPDQLSGDELRSLVEASDSSSSSYWLLYRITKDEYCLKSPRLDVPFAIAHRYCIARSEVMIGNGKDGASAIDYVRAGQWTLLRDRYPSAEEVRF
jgi:hypothetical protein